MKNKEKKGRQWDGKSRISNNVYRKRWEEIFGKKQNKQKEETNEPRKKLKFGLYIIDLKLFGLLLVL